MNKIRVETGALQSAAVVVSLAASEAREGSAIVARAGDSSAFGAEPIAGAYSAMQAGALTAASEIGETTDQLGANLGAAVYGYIITDKGAIPSTRGIDHADELPELP